MLSQSKVHNKNTPHTHTSTIILNLKNKHDMAALLVAVQITHSHVHKLRNEELYKNIAVDTTYEK